MIIEFFNADWMDKSKIIHLFSSYKLYLYLTHIFPRDNLVFPTIAFGFSSLSPCVVCHCMDFESSTYRLKTSDINTYSIFIAPIGFAIFNVWKSRKMENYAALRFFVLYFFFLLTYVWTMSAFSTYIIIIMKGKK